ncbi:hypothetical protein AB0M29_30980 [Streptomyces sp. NPDC051976]|jgi:hypothetical protein|uniref:hypothetical protein n=1 Tax=Streptomyces sp. NPDC051976 TaxID=3154947 RepID=UPI003426F779
MKTTMMFRPIANPRRTTLAHLKDAAELEALAVEVPAVDTAAGEQALPQQTANPRRTVLNELPTA